MSRRGCARRLFLLPENGKEAKTMVLNITPKQRTKINMLIYKIRSRFFRQIWLSQNTDIWLKTVILMQK